MKIQSRWINRIRVILSTNGRLTCGNEDKKGINEKKKKTSLLSFLAGSGGGGEN